MRFWKFSAFLIFAVVLFVCGNVSADVPTAEDPEAWEGLHPKQVKMVKDGKIALIDEDTSEEGEQTRMIKAAMIFDRPIDEVWKLLKATEKQHRYLPDLESCELVERDKDGDKIDFHVKIMMFSIDYRVEHHYDDDDYHLHWHLDDDHDNDMKRVDGFWKLYKVDDKRTLARYGTWIEVADFIPENVMKVLTRNNLPANMKSFYKYVQSGGKYTKPGFKD